MSAVPLPHGMPSFDPNNPMEAVMRMQAMGLQYPGMPEFPQQGFGGRGQPRRRGRRCRDFDTKGYCSRGNTCMFDHGNESVYVPPTAAQGEGKVPLTRFGRKQTEDMWSAPWLTGYIQNTTRPILSLQRHPSPTIRAILIHPDQITHGAEAPTPAAITEGEVGEGAGRVPRSRLTGRYMIGPRAPSSWRIYRRKVLVRRRCAASSLSSAMSPRFPCSHISAWLL